MRYRRRSSILFEVPKEAETPLPYFLLRAPISVRGRRPLFAPRSDTAGRKKKRIIRENRRHSGSSHHAGVNPPSCEEDRRYYRYRGRLSPLQGPPHASSYGDAHEYGDESPTVPASPGPSRSSTRFKTKIRTRRAPRGSFARSRIFIKTPTASPRLRRPRRLLPEDIQRLPQDFARCGLESSPSSDSGIMADRLPRLCSNP